MSEEQSMSSTIFASHTTFLRDVKEALSVFDPQAAALSLGSTGIDRQSAVDKMREIVLVLMTKYSRLMKDIDTIRSEQALTSSRASGISELVNRGLSSADGQIFAISTSFQRALDSDPGVQVLPKLYPSRLRLHDNDIMHNVVSGVVDVVGEWVSMFNPRSTRAIANDLELYTGDLTGSRHSAVTPGCFEVDAAAANPLTQSDLRITNPDGLWLVLETCPSTFGDIGTYPTAVSVLNNAGNTVTYGGIALDYPITPVTTVGWKRHDLYVPPGYTTLRFDQPATNFLWKLTAASDPSSTTSTIENLLARTGTAGSHFDHFTVQRNPKISFAIRMIGIYERYCREEGHTTSADILSEIYSSYGDQNDNAVIPLDKSNPAHLQFFSQDFMSLISSLVSNALFAFSNNTKRTLYNRSFDLMLERLTIMQFDVEFNAWFTRNYGPDESKLLAIS
jgi:hypothetical protein